MNDELPHETGPVVDLNAAAESEVPVAAALRPRIWTVFVVLVLAVVVARFFDADISFLARGIAFIVLGSGFLAMNTWLLRQRKEVRS